MHAGDRGSLAASPPLVWGHLTQASFVEVTTNGQIRSEILGTL